MAQIIKHRRGSLESVKDALKRAGELLVVTGSSGITAANGDSILFLGVDGSTVTPANKFLQGTSVPDLTGASYDTSVDGIPFYDTSAEKLYILNKGGNVEVKATANTNGTGIVSSSAQIDGLGFLQVNGDSVVSSSAQVSAFNTFLEINGDGVVSGSAQVKSLLPAGTVSGSSQVNADSITNFDSNVLTYNNSLGVVSGSSQITISSTTGFTSFSGSVSSSIAAAVAGATWDNLNGKPAGIVSGSSQVVSYLDSQDVNLGGISGSTLDITGNAKIDGNLVLGGNITIGDASSDTISFGGDLSSDIIPSATNTYDLGSATDKFAEVHATTIYGSISATNGVVSGSSQITDGSGLVSSSAQVSAFNTFLEINGDSVVSSSAQVSAYGVFAELNGDGLVSSSAQISSFGTFLEINGDGVHSGSAQVVSSLLNQATDFGTGRVSGDNFGDVAGTSTFTGSFNGDGSGLTGLATDLTISGSTGNDTLDLLNDSLTFAGGTGVTAVVTDNTVTVNVQDGSTSQKGISSFSSTNFSVTSGNVSVKAGGVTAATLNSDVAGTGISLNGVDNSIEVDYGSTSGTAVEGDTSLTVQGTTNEIEVSGGSITLGNGGTVTIGLPDSVTIATASIQDNLSVGGNAIITGNLSVLGTTTTVDSTTVQIGDNILELNIGGAQSTAGLQVTDATAPNTVSGSLLWDGTNDYWKGGALGSEKEFARLNTSPTSNTVLKADANGLLVDSLITDDGTNVTISGTAELRINAATANSFVYFDSNKSLEAVTPSNAGDVIQWNGSSFVASNEIDGGTF